MGLKYHTHYILYIKLLMGYEIKKGLKLVWVKFDTLRNSNSNVNECKDNENYTEQWRQNLILLFSTTNFTEINIKKRIEVWSIIWNELYEKKKLGKEKLFQQHICSFWQKRDYSHSGNIKILWIYSWQNLRTNSIYWRYLNIFDNLFAYK